MTELVNPYADHGTWLRGNLHAHSTNSDGLRTPDRVIEDYAARGYDFLAISDHDTFTDPAECASEPLAMLPAVEVSANGPHVLHIGAANAVTPHGDRQAVVDAIREEGGFAIAAHPNWTEDFTHWPQAELERLDGCGGIEIYNGASANSWGSATATDRWDQLLSDGRRVWGFANDDAHRPWEVGRGWNHVQVDAGRPAEILDALFNGRFYASSGVTVETVEVTEGEIAVKTDDAEVIRFITDHGVVQKTVDGASARFRVPEQLVHKDEHSYVRVECHGSGTDQAWLQPMFLEP